MRSLKQLCTPRKSVFDPQRRDTTLDLADLVEGTIDADEFFDENYVTEGMEQLLKHCFRRMEGQSDQGVFRLRQAMGGGKTHNLLVLGLLAQHPKFRKPVMEGFHEPDAKLGEVKVVAFSGRESNAPLGIWGSLAEQLGKQDHFKDCYSPLSAPGQKAWENLFAGETVLVLLDELAPYLQNAKSKQIGNSDLAEVTVNALSNLLVAIGNPACSRVCLVISELTAAYERGSQRLAATIDDFLKETNRTALPIEPVRLNSDELYHILRTRIFEKLPSEGDIDEVAQGYGKAIRDAKQMAITAQSPEEFASRVAVAYPFHPGIRDLYARFRENPGFQQTRGLIRLMRIVTARLWQTGTAESSYLIAAHDLDFNDQETRAEIAQVNPNLDNAVAHDIASDGNAVAEQMDANLGTPDATDACKLLLMSSLANVPNAVLGLSIPEVITYLCEPGRDLSRLKQDVLERLSTAAWYLHSTRDGKLYFRNVQNLNAKLESLVAAYAPEQAAKMLRERLRELFKPTKGWCYGKVLELPAVDEIELAQDRVTLVVFEPYAGGGLRPELAQFFNQATWKNRVAFLTGTKDTYADLLTVGRRLRAIEDIVGELDEEGVPDNDPQRVDAGRLSDKIAQNFYSAVRETFTVLWYPYDDQLVSADLTMKFDGNRYDGEEQILQLLRDKKKFEDDVSSETFRKKAEQRLFTQQSMPWNEIKRRAATNTRWQWHLPEALDRLKADCLLKDVWREDGGFVDKGPFPQPKTSVVIKEQSRDDETGEAALHVSPVHGDTVYWEVGGTATTASEKLDGPTLKTRELRLSFLCADSEGVHETGDAVEWRNRLSLKYKLFQKGDDKQMELRVAPKGAIRYTSDGSDPKAAGATYAGVFSIPKGAPMVQAYAEAEGIQSEVLRIPISWEQDEEVKVDPKLPATWNRKHATASTKESYEFLERLAKLHGSVVGLTVTLGGEGGVKDWVEVNTSGDKQVPPALVEECLEPLRKVQAEGQVKLGAEGLRFDTGQDLLDWVEETKAELKPGEVVQ